MTDYLLNEEDEEEEEEEEEEEDEYLTFRGNLLTYFTYLRLKMT